MTRLILASASPQRKELLASLGIPFDMIPSTVDEAAYPQQNPSKRALELASLKARDIAAKHMDAWVIGADTLVVSPDGELLEKPSNADEAKRMLQLHSGRISTVHSGLSLIGPGGIEHQGLSSSFVRFHPLSPNDIDWWIETGQWQDRSGGFQVEGLGERLVETIEGDRDGVIGLPIRLLAELFITADAPFTRR